MAGEFSKGFSNGLGLVRSKQELEAEEEARRLRNELEQEILKLRKQEGRKGRELDRAQLDEQIRANKEREFQGRQGFRLAELEQAQRQQNTFRDQLARNAGEVNVSYKGENGELVSMKGPPNSVMTNLQSLQGGIPRAGNSFTEAMAEIEMSDPSGQGKAKMRVPMSELGKYGFPTGDQPAASGVDPISMKLQDLDAQIIEEEMQMAVGGRQWGPDWLPNPFSERPKTIQKLKQQKAVLIREQYRRGQISQEEAKQQLMGLGLEN